ncbi:unnamed protein product [Arabis nemorensis]|uniref:Fungal lipase-type domain-containing protein n=1 Tax=Arabis nemorensis TaxID=586526 RepID=A0A565CUW2_9BRAS|nr:unnamed protein product [Arabis nemorensis]
MSIYGAVFEYERYNLHQDTPHLKAPPRYVIAFRGTILESETILSDMKLNFRIFFNILPGGRRFMHAIQTIHTMVVRHSEPVIWLAGHSLGAALALLAGKTMIRDFGFFLEAHIFNPLVVSFPLEQLPGSKMLKGVFRITRSVIKTTVATVLKDVKIQEDDPSWIPCLYVNPADPICSEYIGYFKHKIFMSKIGASQIEKTGARTSVRSLLVGRKGTSDSSTEPLHLLPSADMTINKNKPTESKTAHGLHQWWEQDSVLRANWESCCIRPYSEGKSGKLLN